MRIGCHVLRMEMDMKNEKVIRANNKNYSNAMNGRGPAIQTISGKLFHILDPKPEEISIRDIAHGLSMQCRFNGHLPQFYSVAQHSVLVAQYMETKTNDKRELLKALMHDAHEAYLGDVVTPLKVLLPEYKEIEDSVDDIICNKFNIPKGMSEQLHEADKVLLATEFRDLRPHGNLKKSVEKSLHKPWKDIEIVPISSEQSYKMFLDKYVEYTDQ